MGGNDGLSNHIMPPMFYSHTGGAGGVVGDKFVVVAGKGFSGRHHGYAEYFHRGSWNKIHHRELEKFELSGACFAGSPDHHVGYLIGGMNGTRIVSTAFTMDFSKKAPYTWGRAN